MLKDIYAWELIAFVFLTEIVCTDVTQGKRLMKYYELLYTSIKTIIMSSSEHPLAWYQVETCFDLMRW